MHEVHHKIKNELALFELNYLFAGTTRQSLGNWRDAQASDRELEMKK